MGGDPTTANTEVWNGTSWTEVTNMNLARGTLTGNGTSTLALATGGSAATGIQATNESWNGTSWTELADLATARYNIQGSTFNSSNTAALVFGGLNPGGVQSATEEWNVPLTNKTITVS
jgi:hypothetical protein